jgi:two-component system, LytTR family, sensor histidine kinase AlgZ
LLQTRAGLGRCGVKCRFAGAKDRERATAAVILAAMTAIPATSTSLAPAWRKGLAVVALNVALWTVLSVLGTLTSLNDDLGHGVQGSYWLIFQSSLRTSLALMCLSCVLYAGVTRWPGVVANARSIAAGYVLVVLVLLPAQMGFLLKFHLEEAGVVLDWTTVETVARFFSLMHWTAVTAVYFAVVTLKIWQQSQVRAQAAAKAQADALALRLALEQQHGLALRAQLEPHFMFNALNAISALVRCDDKEVALTGIDGLSELLRYALRAGEREWVSVGEELDFIGDYLALQRLRYGSRLRIAIDGATDAVRDADCPQLLLQPLVENALRHDLDCHDEDSDIRLTFAREDRQLLINIGNPVREEAAHNPGVGLGLRNIAARLQLAYGAAASIEAGTVAGRFEVTIRMPEYGPD